MHAGGTSLPQAKFHKLAQVGLFVSHHDVVGREVADHTTDAAERRRCHDIVGKYVEQLVLGIGAPFSALKARLQARALDERARVDLDLVGPKSGFAHKALVIALVARGRGAQQVEHEVRMGLKAEQARERERPLDLRNVDATLVDVEQMLVEALHAHLQLGAAEAADGGERGRRDGIGARLDHEADHAMARRLVHALLALELIPSGHLVLGDLAPRRPLAIEPLYATVVGTRFAPAGRIDQVL